MDARRFFHSLLASASGKASQLPGRARLFYILGTLSSLCLFITCTRLYVLPAVLHSVPGPALSQAQPQRQYGHSHDYDLDHALSHDLSQPDAPFVSWPLARVCREATAWTPGVVFLCDNNSGGIGNIRSYILTCLRYAIEAGATGMIMPQIEIRSKKDLSHLFAGKQPMSYFFDAAHFQSSLEAACPQITLFPDMSSVPNLSNTTRVEQITPKHFGNRSLCDYRDLNRHTDLFGLRFRDWMASTSAAINTTAFRRPPVSLYHPRLIQFTWGVQWEWPVWKDGPEFANTYSGLLRLRRDILELGRAVEAAMRRGARQDGRFVGVHLRTENDALGFWPSFAAQAGTYADRIARLGLRDVYLATGNATEAARFANRTGHSVRVITKAQLLLQAQDPLLQRRLDSLTWDQQALVDLIVLLRCDYFLGVSPSSFSMTIAARRHLSHDGLHTRPWKIGGEDGRSYLVGHYESYWDDWLFMYDALWP